MAKLECLTIMQTKRVPYTFNRGGYHYFTRRVPSDLKQNYLCPRIEQGLNINVFRIK